MTVYTVEYLNYEESYIVGIYNTKELAIKILAELEKENEGTGTYCWGEYDVIEE